MSSSPCRSTRRRSRGQGLIEFALIAPALIALIFGVFDVGRALSANVTVTNSSREGARYLIANAVNPGSSSYWSSAASCQSNSGATAPASTTGEAAAWRQLQNASLDLSKVSMTIYFYASNNDPAGDPNRTAYNLRVSCPSTGTAAETGTYTPQSGDWVVFTVTYAYAPVTPLISSLISTVTVTQTATMVIE